MTLPDGEIPCACTRSIELHGWLLIHRRVFLGLVCSGVNIGEQNPRYRVSHVTMGTVTLGELSSGPMLASIQVLGAVTSHKNETFRLLKIAYEGLLQS